MKLKLFKSNGIKITKKVKKIIEKANYYRDTAQWEHAISFYNEALNVDSNLYHIWVQLGHAYKENNNISSAYKAYEYAYHNFKDSDAKFHFESLKREHNINSIDYKINNSNNIVVGMTTLGRPSLITSLQSILNQVDDNGDCLKLHVVLSIPVGVLLNEEVKEFLENHKSNISVLSIRDYGPISKLIGALEYSKNNNDIIILADDDVFYTNRHFYTLIKYFYFFDQKNAVGTSGFNWNGEIRRYPEKNFIQESYVNTEEHAASVSVIETWCGVCLKREWFKPDFIDIAKTISISKPDLLRTDDSFYSIYLEMMAIGKIVINDINCNRYDSGFSNLSKSFNETINTSYASLNGVGDVSMQWVRYAQYAMEIRHILYTHCNAEKTKKKIAMVTVCCGENYRNKTITGRKTKIQYCEKYGYDYIEINEPLNKNIPILWSKLLSISKLLDQKYDIVFYTDADALITNPTIRIEKLISASDADIIFTYDVNGPNIGNLLVKNTKESRQIITDIYNMKEFHTGSKWYDQAAFIVYMRKNEDKRMHFAGVPQRYFNSYVYSWGMEDFIVHLAGIYGPILGDVMDAIYKIAYLDKDVRPDTYLTLSPFFKDYQKDDNMESYLVPNPNNDQSDVYKIINNQSINKTLIFMISDDNCAVNYISMILSNIKNITIYNPMKKMPSFEESGFNIIDQLNEFVENSKDDFFIINENFNLKESDYFFQSLKENYNIVFIKIIKFYQKNEISFLENFKEQSLLIKNEDIFNDTCSVISRVTRFLNIWNIDYKKHFSYKEDYLKNKNSILFSPVWENKIRNFLDLKLFN